MRQPRVSRRASIALPADARGDFREDVTDSGAEAGNRSQGGGGDTRRAKSDPFADQLYFRESDFQVADDGKMMAVRAANRLRVLKVGPKPNGEGDAPGRKSGWVDLHRLRVPVIPGVEWTQMFNEVWRLQRDREIMVDNGLGVCWKCAAEDIENCEDQGCFHGSPLAPYITSVI